MIKTLLLNSTYETLTFITEKKLWKLLFKDKIDVVSTYDTDVQWGKRVIKHPSTVKLKNFVKINYYSCPFSRRAIVKRDGSICQYCSKKLTASQVTIDHIIPSSNGGNSSFVNCVVACHDCNNFNLTDCRNPLPLGRG